MTHLILFLFVRIFMNTTTLTKANRQADSVEGKPISKGKRRNPQWWGIVMNAAHNAAPGPAC